jgi:beta-lactamase superfamily II metal-dependent hydrolase
MDGFVSVGEKNKYHHPNIDTLINIHKQGCHPMVVTEDLSTMIVQTFDF